MPRRAQPPTLAAAREAAQAIHDRRTNHKPDDPDVWRLPDPADLYGMADFCLTYRRVSHDTRQLDALDVVVIAAYLRSRAEDQERRGTDAARELGLPWDRIGSRLGLTRQGAQQRRLRLDAANLDEPRTERAVRAAVRQRGNETAAGVELAKLIEDVVVVLEFASALRDDEDVQDYLTALRHSLFGQDATQGPVLIANARLLLRALANHPTPEGCGELLADLADKLPAQRPS